MLISMVLAMSAAAADVVPTESGFNGAATVTETKVNDGFYVVTAEVPFIDVHGAPQMGQARLVLPKDAMDEGRSLPAFCHVHYEKDVDGAKGIAKHGWAVSTAVYDGDHPIDTSVGNGNNLARAIIQWVRRLPFIDRQRLHIDGGSQGGYMALAMSAENFPVTSTTADMPVVNWDYNFNYFIVNKPVTKYPIAPQDSPLPVVAIVTGLADQSTAYFGEDMSAEAWYYVSPISYTDRIANPVLVTSATGDMLVPIEQMTRKHVRPCDPEKFPEGYQRDFDTLTLCDKARVVFEDCLPKDQTCITLEPKQEHSYIVTFDMFQDATKRPERQPDLRERKWSKDHQWNLSYMDEGPPLPEGNHTSWHWSLMHTEYWAYHQEKAPGPEILNEAKLRRLVERYDGKLTNLPKLKDGAPVHRLSFPELEQRDVITGLKDYAAMGEAHRARLAELCEAIDAPEVFRAVAR